MSVNPQLNSSNYILNITSLQNTITTASGLTPYDVLLKQVKNVQEMVDYSNRRINTDVIAKFTSAADPISMINSLNLCNANLYSNGVLFTMGGSSNSATTLINGNGIFVGSTGLIFTSTNISMNVQGTTHASVGSNGLVIPTNAIQGTALQCLDTVGTTAWGYVSTLATADSITFSQGPTEIARFTSGNLGIGTTTPVNTLDVVGSGGFTGKVSAFEFLTLSDRRFKTNITQIENAGDLLDKMRGVRFMWRDLSNNDIGVIAQELQEVLPEAVIGEEKLSVAYHKIVPVLIEVVKDLKERIRVLEERSRN
jgi:hypothetical protein